MLSRLVAVAAVALLAAACGQGSHPKASPTTPPGAEPVWLCQPGTSPDPCQSDLDAAVVTATGGRSVQPGPAPGDSPFDCFYVYPTVSAEKGVNADLAIQAGETAVAR
ncbi:MAG TPA: hypothetical protein VFH58_14850, partial [Acidimicrobiales bacterium]|nr:hypothetical protein [Acidimicrobiales bacterium]